ncbi:dTDP-4-amino-4,6-dideoxy-D-glucose transaminase [compost metagenome]
MDDQCFPVSRDVLFLRLRDAGILARRYFYPLISEFPMYRGLDSAQPKRLENAFDISRQVICLPIFPHMQEHEQDEVIAVILDAAQV